MQLRRLRVLRCRVTQQHGAVVASHQAGGNRHGHVRSGDRFVTGWRGDFFRFSNSDDHFRQGCQPIARRDNNLVGDGDQLIIVRGVQDRQLGAALDGRAQTRGQQGVILAQERTDDEGALDLAKFADRHAQPWFHAGVEREVGLAQAEVKVLGTEAVGHFLQQDQLFDGRMRGGQRGDGVSAMLVLDIFQTVRHVFQRGLPIDFFPLVALFQHRGCQAFGAVQRFVRETVLVRDPALVDGFVFQRQYALDLASFHLHDQVGTEAVMRADRFAARQFPRTGAVAERLRRQCADRAQVDHVARQFGIDRLADKRHDFRVLAAADHAQLHHAGHFLAKAYAAGALDAARHFLHGHQRTGFLRLHDALVFLVARFALAVAHCQVLQLAFAALIADRAIERVVNQQEFHDRLLRLHSFIAGGAHDHAGTDRGRTSGQRLGRLFHFDQAHAAVRCDRQFLVIAEVRNVGSQFVGGVHHHATSRDFDFFAVYFDFNHGDRYLTQLRYMRALSNACARYDIQILHGNS